jgi:hypothetical protein
MSNRQELLAFVGGREMIDREEIIARFGSSYRVPSYEKLSKSYIAAKIAQGFAQARDGDGRRIVLARRGKDGVQYVNIDVCKSPVPVEDIRRRIENDIIGQGASLEKVGNRIAVVGKLKRNTRRKSR